MNFTQENINDNQSVSSLGSSGTHLTEQSKHSGKSGRSSKSGKSKTHLQHPVNTPATVDHPETKLETKDDLVMHIRKWIQYDNEIRQLQALAKKRREAKKQITQDLVNVMKDNEIEKFNLRDGKLVYKQTKRNTPLNEKHIIHCLMDVFQNEPKRAQEITEMIMNRRETKMVETVQRRVDKNARDTIMKEGKESIRKMIEDELE